VKAIQEKVAPRLSVTAIPISLAKPDDLTEAFATIVREQAEALLVLPVPVAFSPRFKISDFCDRAALAEHQPATWSAMGC
jgi:hypothetical protein